MERIELQDVEYGDCTVLVGRDNSILMVDCGSVSQYVRSGSVDIDTRFAEIFHRYIGASKRHFLLTHYHRDHMNGFLKKLDHDPNYFDRVYIPYIPTENGTAPILEIAVFARHFSVPQSDFSQVNTVCLSIFEALQETVGAQQIFTLGAGDTFIFDNVTYSVLSPDKESFSYPELLCEAVTSLNELLAKCPEAAGFMRLKNEFILAYQKCQTGFSTSSKTSLGEKQRLLDVLSEKWNALEDTRGALEHLHEISAVRGILEDALLRMAYTETQNDLSLVFHNVRGHVSDIDILMTGDVSGEILSELSPKLYDGYFAVKAPHHGTESHFPAVLRDIYAAHLLISNGDYHAGGNISDSYLSMECIRHCTNCSVCGIIKNGDSCCNLLTRCWEQPAGGQLTLRCMAAKGNCRTPCGIYVFGHNGVYGCHCDR